MASTQAEARRAAIRAYLADHPHTTFDDPHVASLLIQPLDVGPGSIDVEATRQEMDRRGPHSETVVILYADGSALRIPHDSSGHPSAQRKTVSPDIRVFVYQEGEWRAR